MPHLRISNRGLLSLGDYSTLRGIVLTDTEIVGGPHLHIQHCNLTRCDLRALLWGMLDLCLMTDCLLPSDAPKQAVVPIGLRAVFEQQGQVMWSTPSAQEEAARCLLESPDRECEHDWRRDPFAPVKTSHPPQYRTVCAKCKAERWVSEKAPSRNPADWPKIASR